MVMTLLYQSTLLINVYKQMLKYIQNTQHTIDTPKRWAAASSATNQQTILATIQLDSRYV